MIQAKCDATALESEELEEELTVPVRHHRGDRDRLGAILSGLVQAILSSGSYDAQAAFDNRGEFRGNSGDSIHNS